MKFWNFFWFLFSLSNWKANFKFEFPFSVKIENWILCLFHFKKIFVWVLIWSVKWPKLPFKNESFHQILLKIENKYQMLIFISIEFWSASAIFEFRFLFNYQVKLNFWICFKITSKNDIYFRPRLFLSTNCYKGLSKGCWIKKDILSSFYFFNSFIRQQWIRLKQKKCVTFSSRK